MYTPSIVLWPSPFAAPVSDRNISIIMLSRLPIRPSVRPLAPLPRTLMAVRSACAVANYLGF